MTERLVKVIARSGAASRRGAGDLVKAGKVTVNGEIVDNPGLAVDPAHDHVKVDGKLITPLPPIVYLMLHKPAGYLTTREDPEGRPTVMELIRRVKAPVFPVGRLDKDTEGLLLFTNDGDLAQRMLHPKFRVKRVYWVKVRGRMPQSTANALRDPGVSLKDGPARPDHLKVLGRDDNATRLRVTLTEGRKRLVRRMMDAAGHPVVQLIREKFGPISLGDLKSGAMRFLDEREVAQLRKLAAGGPSSGHSPNTGGEASRSPSRSGRRRSRSS